MLGIIVPFSGDEKDEDDIQIYVKSNGVHTEICMPTESEYFNWKEFIDTSAYPSGLSCNYISMGWGDKGFFLETPTWGDLKASTAIEAIFLPSSTAMHVQYFNHAPAESEQCYLERISGSRYKSLVLYIQGSFLLDHNKAIHIPGGSYWGTDQFYEAKGDYHLFNTCNSWTNGALKMAGIRTASFALFPSTIMNYRK